MKIKTALAGLLILGTMTFSQAVAQSNTYQPDFHRGGPSASAHANTQMEYSDTQLAAIRYTNRDLLTRMPAGEMQVGTVVTKLDVTISAPPASLVKNLLAIPVAVFGKEVRDKIPAVQITVMMDSETRGIYARSSADSRAVSFFLPIGEAQNYKPGDHVMVGKTGNTIMMQKLDQEQDNVYTSSATADEQRKNKQDVRAESRENSREVFRAISDTVLQNISTGRITPSPAQMRRMADGGLSPELAAELLKQLKKPQAVSMD